MARRIGWRQRWHELRTIAFLTLDTLFWSRKTLFVALISLIVLGLAALGRAVIALHLIPSAPTPGQLFGTLMATAVLRFLVVFVTLFYGTALISEEVENKTLTYLLVRPIPKPVIMLGKFLALSWTGAILVLPIAILSYLILYLGSDPLPLLEGLSVLGRDIGVIVLALLAYGSLFGLLGAWLRHPILVGLLYAFGWEGIISVLPGFTRRLTIVHYLQSVFSHSDTPGAISMLMGERTGTAEALVTLILMSAFFLSTACLMVREKEYILEQ